MATRVEKPEPAVDVNLSTAETVQALLERAGVPVSRNWLLQQLAQMGRATTRPRLNRVLNHFFRLELAVEGSKGIQWTHNLSPQLLYAAAFGKKL